MNSDLTTWLEASTSIMDVLLSWQQVPHSSKYSKVFHYANSFNILPPTYVLFTYIQLKMRILQCLENSTGLI
jgi:hypothetical protein